MRFNEHQMMAILSPLWAKTVQNEVHWEASGNSYYTALRPDIVFSIAATPDQITLSNAPPAPLVYRIRVIGNQNDVLGELEGKNGTPQYSPLQQLYEHVERTMSDQLFRAITQNLNQPGKIGIRPARGPLQPTVDQKKEIIQKMKGKWNLDYTSGNETATIDEAGAYHIQGFGDNPRFILTVIACNDVATRAEVAKDYFRDGKRHSTEVLSFTADSMFGVIKEDGRRLKYTRVAP